MHVKRKGRSAMFKLKMILIFSILLFFSYANANDCLIKDGLINGIGIGDTKEKIFSTFSSKYQIVDEKKPNYLPTVTLHQDKKR